MMPFWQLRVRALSWQLHGIRLNLPSRLLRSWVSECKANTYIEFRDKLFEEVEKLLVKTLLWVKEKAKAEGRIKEEVRIVKSITLLMTRIDAQKEGRNE